MYSRNFALATAGVDPRRFRCFDAAGFNTSNTGRKKVRCRKGDAHTLAVGGRHGKHFTALGITSLTNDFEPVVYSIYEGNLDAEEYCNFMIRQYDQGHILPGDVIVLDNWSGQAGELAREMERVLLSDNIVFLPLPVFTPEWNPIEYVWSAVKYRMRRLGPRGNNDDVLVRIAAALDTITHTNIASFYKFCGYM